MPDHELFGTLRLLRGGKHGYIGVRGGQGKKRDRFQAYASVNSQKVTVSGLFSALRMLLLWLSRSGSSSANLALQRSRNQRSVAKAVL